MEVKSPEHLVLCNGAEIPESLPSKDFGKIHNLELWELSDNQNIRSNLKELLSEVYYLSDRLIDLLEMASYVFSADRLSSRGSKKAVEYHSWSRIFHFVIKVRDYEFWNDKKIKRKLNQALKFMTGDKEYKFTFLKGEKNKYNHLFNEESFKKYKIEDETHICLFSGGLDSLAGAIDILKNSNKNVYLVSNISNPGTKRTQNKLVNKLKEEYPNRIVHYKYQCNFKGIKSRDESQRTRAFLYGTIAFAICEAYSINKFYIYENGITSLNFSRRADLINARASRTTHPKTIKLLEELFSSISNNNLNIELPFLWKTKTNIMELISKNGFEHLINSSVSCSRTRKKSGQSTHCGQCFQCVDRKFASYASGLDNIDESGIYDFNFINNSINDKKVKTTIVDYVRQAIEFYNTNIDDFYYDKSSELIQIIEYINIEDEMTAVEKIYELCNKHGEQVIKAIKKMRDTYDDPSNDLTENSFLEIISNREYLKPPITRLIEDICQKLKKSIPIAFQSNSPNNENDFNDKVSSILNAEKSKFNREYPSISFALAKTVPDHSNSEINLLIESKYIRGSTTPSKITDGIAADIVKYNIGDHILFVVYDPERELNDDEVFKRDFEKNNDCSICIIR